MVYKKIYVFNVIDIQIFFSLLPFFNSIQYACGSSILA